MRLIKLPLVINYIYFTRKNLCDILNNSRYGNIWRKNYIFGKGEG